MRAAAVIVLSLGFSLLPASVAWAHVGEESVPAKTTVEEAIAIIATQPEQMDAIDDKLGDAQESEDTTGVDEKLVKQAAAAFDDGDMDTTLLLLEQSIGVKPGETMTDPTSGLPSPAPLPPSQEPITSPLLAESPNHVSTMDTAWLLVLAAAAVVLGLLVVRRYR